MTSSESANAYYDLHHPHGRPTDPRSLAAVPATGVHGGAPVRVAAVAVLNSAGQILTGFSKKRHVWDIPQGVAEGSETLQETACRELLEETGISVAPIQLEVIATFRHKTPEFVFPWETTLYLAHADDVSVARNLEPEKCASLGWFAPVQLPTPRGLSLRVLLTLLGR